MASFNKFNSFVEALAEKVHNLGSDQIVVANLVYELLIAQRHDVIQRADKRHV
jgi:hypothetical protein